MDRLIYLLKDHQVGTWCKRAAWIILAFNLIQLLIYVYARVIEFHNIPNFAQQPLLSTSINLLPYLLSVVSNALFNFLILYVAAVVVEYFAGSREEQEEEEEMPVQARS